MNEYFEQETKIQEDVLGWLLETSSNLTAEFLDAESSEEDVYRWLIGEEPRIWGESTEDEAPEWIIGEQAVNQAQQEWNGHPNIHHHFNFPQGPAGFQAYAQLRPLYVAQAQIANPPQWLQGIANPAQWIDNNIINVTFFGRRTPAHRDTQAPLQAAEQTLRNQNCIPQILRGGNGFWGFVPRTTAGGALSNHALGRAFDINTPENPHIKNRHDIRVIRAVTCVNLGRRQPAATLRWADQGFRRTFNQQWVNQQMQRLQQLQAVQNPSAQIQQQIQRLQQLVQSINARRNTLDRYARNGFLNLEQPLIDALIGAGFTWGGQWQNSKDFMHFEL